MPSWTAPSAAMRRRSCGLARGPATASSSRRRSRSRAPCSIWRACARGSSMCRSTPPTRAAELGYFIEDAEPKLVFAPGHRDLAELDAPPGRTSRRCRARPDDLAAILYTSGTTGRSKGAMLSHDNLAVQCAGAEGLLALAAGRRADPRAADLPCPRPVRGAARRAAERRDDALARGLRRRRGPRRPGRARRC